MPGRHALLVGINRYPNISPKSQLTNCLRDVDLMQATLRERLGFAAEDLIFRRDEEATRAGILAGLQELLDRARLDDLVVFYFAGHGSQLDALGSWEPDGLSQTIVPCDRGLPGAPLADIRDDELYDWLLEVSKVTRNSVIIADTCFSGGLVREGDPARSRWLEGLVVPLSQRPPSPFSRGVRSSGLRDRGPAGFLPLSDRYILLAACERGQRAKEIPERLHGIFTYHLCETLQRLSPSSSYRELQERVRLAVHARFSDQSPQVEGDRNRPIFGGVLRLPDPYLLVEEREGDRLTLGGGAMHGVGVGSVWGIYPIGVPAPARGKELGRLTIVEVGAVESVGELRGGPSSGAIIPGCRAFEREKGPQWLTFAVAIEGAAGTVGASASAKRLDNALRRAIKGSPVLRLASGRGDADALVVGRQPGDRPVGAPEVVLEAGWGVEAPDGTPRLAVQPLSQPQALQRLIERLERLAIAKNLAELRPEQTEVDSLASHLQIELGRRWNDGTFKPVELAPSAGRAVFLDGDRLALQIVNTSATPLHLHVLDVGLTGGRCTLYPALNKHAPLTQGRVLTVGALPDSAIELSVPDDLPASATGGLEVVMVFASIRETDLSVWDSKSLRDSPPLTAAPGSLQALAARACGGRVAPLREGPGAVSGEATWTVVTKTFWVERTPRP